MSEYKLARTIIGKLPHGSDLLEGLTEIVQRENIRCGRIHALGATTHAVVAYYDQIEKKYNPMEFPDGMEILNLHGNISIRDEKSGSTRMVSDHAVGGEVVFALSVGVPGQLLCFFD